MKIITDGTSDLQNPEKYGIDVVPIIVYYGDNEITSDKLNDENVRSQVMKYVERADVKTSQPSPKAFLDAYERANDDVVVLTISSKLSGIYNSALLAKKIFERTHDKKVTVIDSKTGAFMLGYLAMKAAQLKDVEKVIELRDKMKAFGVLDTLKNAVKSGRIPAAKGLIARALSLKPMFELIDGEIKSTSSLRGDPVERLVKKLGTYVSDERINVMVVHGGVRDKAEELMKRIKERFNVNESYIEPLGPALMAHLGPRCLIVSFHVV